MLNSLSAIGVVLRAFRYAVINLLIRKNVLDHNVLKRYRLVASFSFVTKCLDRIASAQLMSCLSRHDIFTVVPNKSNMPIHSSILLALGYKEDVVLAMLDSPVAFDTLDHVVLQKRLRIKVFF